MHSVRMHHARGLSGDCAPSAGDGFCVPPEHGMCPQTGIEEADEVHNRHVYRFVIAHLGTGAVNAAAEAHAARQTTERVFMAALKTCTFLASFFLAKSKEGSWRASDGRTRRVVAGAAANTSACLRLSKSLPVGARHQCLHRQGTAGQLPRHRGWLRRRTKHSSF